MSGCTVFVFCSLMEYALVNIVMGDVMEGDESALRKGMKSIFMAARFATPRSKGHASSQASRTSSSASNCCQLNVAPLASNVAADQHQQSLVNLRPAGLLNKFLFYKQVT